MTRRAAVGRTTGRRIRVLAGGLITVLLLWNNVVVPLAPDSTTAYTALNLSAAAVLLAVARWAGLSWAELGLSRRRLQSGLAWGGVPAAAIALALAVAVTLPALRPLLADARAADRGLGDVAVEVGVRIPFGTVLWEEIAFRGVLLALLLRVLSTPRAVGVAAVVFGIWHIRPTLSGLAANELAEGPWLRGLAVLAACAATAAVGVLLSWMRMRSGSLLAPVLLHLAANTLGTVAATAATRLG